METKITKENLPIRFEAKQVGETEKDFIFEIPKEIQERLPDNARYVHIRILDFSNGRDTNA